MVLGTSVEFQALLAEIKQKDKQREELLMNLKVCFKAGTFSGSPYWDSAKGGGGRELKQVRLVQTEVSTKLQRCSNCCKLNPPDQMNHSPVSKCLTKVHV